MVESFQCFFALFFRIFCRQIEQGEGEEYATGEMGQIQYSEKYFDDTYEYR